MWAYIGNMDAHAMNVLVGGFGSLHGQNSPGIERFVYEDDAPGRGRVREVRDGASISSHPHGAPDAADCTEGSVSLTNRGVLASLPSPTWLCHDADIVYVVLEDSDEVASLILGKDGDGVRLRLRSRIVTTGKGPTHAAVAVDDLGGRHLLVANYGNGALSVHSLAEDGGMMPAAQTFEGEGSGPLPAQEGPHAHWILPLPDGRVLSTDLGADRIYVHAWDCGTLQRIGTIRLKPGTGPRDMHILPTPLARSSRDWTVAVVCEWSCEVIVLRPQGSPLDEDCGIRAVQNVPLGALSGDQAASLAYMPLSVLRQSEGAGGADAAARDPEGCAHCDPGSDSDREGGAIQGYAYVGLRGSDRIVALSYAGGSLVRMERGSSPEAGVSPDDAEWVDRGVSAAGSRPRQLCRIGGCIVAANEASNELSVFRVGPGGYPRLAGRFPANSPTVLVPLP